MTKNSNNILIGIGPDNPKNKNNFYNEWFTFSCLQSSVVLKSEEFSEYNGNSGKLKNDDIIEVIVDRINGNLSFAVNYINYGKVNCEIKKGSILYPFIIICDQDKQVELVQNIIKLYNYN